jgi:cytochrome P450
MRFLLGNALAVLLFYKVTLPDWMLPKMIGDVKHAVADFRKYMMANIEKSQDQLRKNPETDIGEIATALIQANEAAKREEKTTEMKHGHLTDDELLGNLYLLNLAGFETTANALTYTIPYLTAQPMVQDWLREEIDRMLKLYGDVESWKYETVFPQLTRCMAVMYETLRLWQPITDSTRCTSGSTIALKVFDKTIMVPKGVILSTNNYGISSDPRWWGKDSLEWKPKRWIIIDKDGNETLASPPKGAFVAWSVGPRVCPGKKFSQVEFTSVIAFLLARYKLEPLVMSEKGMKTEEDGRKALTKAIWASGNTITPKVGRVKEAGIRIVKR